MIYIQSNTPKKMKRFITTLILLCASKNLCFAQYSFNINHKHNQAIIYGLPNFKFKGPVKSVIKKEVFFGLNDSLEMRVSEIYKLNTHGSPSEYIEYLPFLQFPTSPNNYANEKYNYNVDGKLIERKKMYVENSEKSKTPHLIKSAVFLYDTLGNLIQCNQFISWNGEKDKNIGTIKYFYNNKSQIIQSIEYDTLNKLISKSDFEYNNDGNIILISKREKDGFLESIVKFNQSLLENYNWSSNRNGFKYCFRYTYEDGVLISTSENDSFFNRNGILNEVFTRNELYDDFKFDNQQNLVKESSKVGNVKHFKLTSIQYFEPKIEIPDNIALEISESLLMNIVKYEKYAYDALKEEEIFNFNNLNDFKIKGNVKSCDFEYITPKKNLFGREKPRRKTIVNYSRNQSILNLISFSKKEAYSFPLNQFIIHDSIFINCFKSEGVNQMKINLKNSIEKNNFVNKSNSKKWKNFNSKKWKNFSPFNRANKNYLLSFNFQGSLIHNKECFLNSKNKCTYLLCTYDTMGFIDLKIRKDSNYLGVTKYDQLGVMEKKSIYYLSNNKTDTCLTHASICFRNSNLNGLKIFNYPGEDCKLNKSKIQNISSLTETINYKNRYLIIKGQYSFDFNSNTQGDIVNVKKIGGGRVIEEFSFSYDYDQYGNWINRYEFITNIYEKKLINIVRRRLSYYD